MDHLRLEPESMTETIIEGLGSPKSLYGRRRESVGFGALGSEEGIMTTMEIRIEERRV